MLGTLLLALTAAVGGSVTSAKTCAPTGAESPAVVTVIASKENPKTDVWRVDPNCTVNVENVFFAADPPRGWVWISTSATIERIDSVPSQLQTITIKNAPLSQGINFTGAPFLYTVTLHAVGVSMDRVQFPPSVSSITIVATSYRNSSRIKAIEKTTWPSELRSLTISEYPPPLPELNLPDTLDTLVLKNQKLPEFARQSLPDSLETLIFDSTVISSIYGVRWPALLRTLDFGEVPIKSFEVRESDLTFFQKLDKLNGVSSQSSCSRPTASLQSVGKLKLCVIPDDLADKLYGAPIGSRVIRSGTFAWYKFGEEERNESAGGSLGSNDEQANFKEAARSGRTATPEIPSITPSTSPSITPSISATTRYQKRTHGNALLLVSLGGTVVVVVAFACFGFRVFRSSQRSEETETHSGNEHSSDRTSTSSYSLLTMATKKRKVPKHNSTSFGINGDVRKDKTIYPFFIEFSEIELGEVVAASGYGVVYRATFQHLIVAVKRLLPDSWRDEQTITRFMDEIRLCAKLDHPRIVEFHGITWTTQRDLSTVVEFMRGGDLHSVLQSHLHPSPRDWLDKWSSANLKCKAAIAYDASEALTYLHSFRSSIIHRDLKARNILLDRVGNAKLSGFGVSREVQVDKTMTAEVGTSAWIAPEVLRGERYSEKVDIYSFGVLLVEMDRCAHPFEDALQSGLVLQRSNGVFQNAHFTMGVSTGELRPTVSSGCPESIRAIAERCVDFDPGSRPLAMELSFALRQFTYRKA